MVHIADRKRKMPGVSLSATNSANPETPSGLSWTILSDDVNAGFAHPKAQEGAGFARKPRTASVPSGQMLSLAPMAARH